VVAVIMVVRDWQKKKRRWHKGTLKNFKFVNDFTPEQRQ
jgi:hypothetical protein